MNDCLRRQDYMGIRFGEVMVTRTVQACFNKSVGHSNASLICNVDL